MMERFTGIKAIFFDAGNTIIFPNYRLMEKVLSTYGVRTTAEELFRLDCEQRDQYNRRAAAGEETRHLWEQYWVALLRRAGMTRDIQTEVIKELTVRSEQGALWLQVLDGTAETLGALQASGRTLGVVSNSEGRLESFLEQVGVRQYFAFVLDSAIIGINKPDPGIFRMALERAGVQPHEALFVGDNYPIDILGARRVGMAGVLFNPAGHEGVFDCPVIDRLNALEELLN